MLLRRTATALMLTCSSLAGYGQVLTLEQAATFGEAHPPEVQTGLAAIMAVEAVMELCWVSDELLLVVSVEGQDCHVRCIRAADGTEVWRREIGGQLFDYTRLSVTGDRSTLVASNPRYFRVDGETIDSDVSAIQFDTSTGELVSEVPLTQVRQLSNPTRMMMYQRTVIAGPTRDTVIVTFADDEQDSQYGHGYRGYLIDLQKEERVYQYRLDSGVAADSIAISGQYFGYAQQDVFCVFDAVSRRDRVLAGEHGTLFRTVLNFEYEAPCFSNLRIGGNTVIVTRDVVAGEGKFYVIGLEDGNIRADRFALRGRMEMDVDFEREIVALTGSSRDLLLFNFDGQQLAFLEGVSDRRIHTIAISPDGQRVAIGGESNVVQVFSISGLAGQGDEDGGAQGAVTP